MSCAQKVLANYLSWLIAYLVRDMILLSNWPVCMRFISSCPYNLCEIAFVMCLFQCIVKHCCVYIYIYIYVVYIYIIPWWCLIWGNRSNWVRGIGTKIDRSLVSLGFFIVQNKMFWFCIGCERCNHWTGDILKCNASSLSLPLLCFPKAI